MATCRFMPPESWCGQASANLRKPTMSMKLSTLSRTSFFGRKPSSPPHWCGVALWRQRKAGAVAGVVAGDHAEQQGGVGDAACRRPGMRAAWHKI
jgi:hypothetical protein